MRIVRDYPPLWDEINARFRIGNKGVIFAWGETIYNPQSIDIDDALVAHEAVHGHRQGGDIEGWWRRYMDDAEFRLREEIPAHMAEYHARLANARNRNERRACEKDVAKRLAAPLYGGLITPGRARQLLKRGEKMLNGAI